MKKIILASSSPRRCALLNQMGIIFDLQPSNIDEDAFNHLKGSELVKTLSIEKAKNIFNKLERKEENILIIGCDSIVSFEDKILGKPKDKQDALNMLMLLNGNMHTVFTGLSVIGFKDNVYFEETICSSSNVYFSKFSKNQLLEYVNTLEPMDKAGSYGIQGKGGFLVSKIDGDFYSIMGLPINKLYNLLNKYGFLCHKKFTN
ncbi:nucleoside triphosphate pyrophosphatase [uncultured Tyzzerella sp.]|uniref:nucleoside triphosphate pyrophosphatase n=1 Tax=uncultured Tyzzerella sp. TaxID=2321398 RepID=UPI002943E03B|nr:nucleoside triphosphate pyrophosphatase [uncultured Tyzzerella sp.]